MQLNSYKIKTISDMFEDCVFLQKTEDEIILTRIIKNNPESTGVSYINSSVPVAQFIVNAKEKRIKLKTAYSDYESLVNMQVIDDTVDEPLMKKIYEDFQAQYTTYVLTGDIQVG